MNAYNTSSGFHGILVASQSVHQQQKWHRPVSSAAIQTKLKQLLSKLVCVIQKRQLA